MPRLENQNSLVYFRAVPFNTSATVYGQTVGASAVALHSVLVTSHSGGTFKLWNHPTSPINPIGGTYTLAAGSQVLNFQVPIEFTNGLYITTAPANAFIESTGATTGLVINYN